MRQLRLVALSDDGAHLILSDGGEEQLVLQVDERLHAAIRGDRARLGQLEIQLESQLRPRDIQARIRSGESVESVAALSGMPLDKIERFAGPVIAERQHIAERARQATVRRLQGEGKPPSLDTAASESAKAHGIDPAAIEWDAWRRDDGRWIVRCAWNVESDEVFATFSFEPTGRSVIPEDDAARLLSGEIVPESSSASLTPAPVEAAPPVSPVAKPVEPAPEPDEPMGASGPTGVVDDLDVETMPEVPAGPARLSVVQGARDRPEPSPPDADDRPAAAGDDVRRPSRRSTPYGRSERRRRNAEAWDRENTPDEEITSERLRLSDIASNVQVDGPTTAEMEPVSDDPASTSAPAAEPSREAAQVTTAPSDDAQVASGAQAPGDAQVAASGTGSGQAAGTAEPEAESEAEKKPVKRSSKNKRPSVPSWDEIMFGRRKPD